MVESQPVSDSRFRWRSRIRFVDTDASRRIHYTAMFRHFEAAEWEFFRTLGFGYGRATESEISFPRVHVECDFLAALTCDDEIEIAVGVERVGASSYTLALEALLEGRPAARGKIVAVAMNRRTGKACMLPDTLAETLREKVTAE